MLHRSGSLRASWGGRQPVYSLALNPQRPYTARHEPDAPHRPLACLSPSAFAAGRAATIGQACGCGSRQPSKSDPWLYRGSDVPPDPDWLFGELPNGLRYAVRRNGVPPDQVSIRIRIDAGSLNESESERGYAHLIEHLVFRELKYLGDAQAIPTWQRLGASFGNDTNAETTPTQTVYKLDLPGATAASIEESFKLLSGMMTAPALSEANVRTEVPIVLAEKRERGGAVERMQEATRETFFAGQLLASRSPIGTVASLEGTTAASVRGFYSRWYRPENAVIIAAGDADPAVLEAQIVKWFGAWRAPGKPVPAPSFGDPVAPVGVTCGQSGGRDEGAGRAGTAALGELCDLAALAAGHR